MIRLPVLALGAALLCVAAARGTSTPPVTLTPKNVGDHPHLTVTAEGDGDGTRFRVSVGAKDAKLPPEVNGGSLTVRDGERLVCDCQVQPQSGQNRVVFEFVVAGNCLEKSRFSFTVATASPEERKKLPSGGGWTGYQFTLKDFVAPPAAKEVPKGDAKPGAEVKRPAKPRAERYFTYWLTRDPPDPKSTAYEPLLLLARYSMEEFADEKGPLGAPFRNLEPLLPKQPPTEPIEAAALTIETYEKDSIWNPDGRPFKPVGSIDGIDPKKRHVAVNGVRYRYEACPLREAVRLLEYPLGTVPVHRVALPAAGPAQTQTARALRALLREQLEAEVLPKTDPRVRAFVAYLERNGLKLVVGGERGEWWITGDAQAKGPREVRLRAFSPVVSEKWMRVVLADTSRANELNAPARLAVFKSNEVKGAEAELLRLLRRYETPADVVAADKGVAKDQDALLAFLKGKGVELRPAENPSNYIQQMFTVGPDHDQKLLVGLNYLPPLSADEAAEQYGAIPFATHRGWALFRVGGPGGNATEEYEAVWKKAEAAFKAYPAPAGDSRPVPR